MQRHFNFNSLPGESGDKGRNFHGRIGGGGGKESANAPALLANQVGDVGVSPTNRQGYFRLCLLTK
jgi:hypothetical protein